MKKIKSTTKNIHKTFTESSSHRSKDSTDYIKLAQTPEYGSCTVEYKRNNVIVITPKDPSIPRRTVHAGQKAEHPLRRWLAAMKDYVETGKKSSALTAPSEVSSVVPKKEIKSIENMSKKERKAHMRSQKEFREGILNIIKGSNAKDCDIPFIKSFYSSLIKEQEEEVPASDVLDQKTPDDFTPDRTRKDYEDSLEPQTDKESFDIEGLDPNISTESIKKIKEWSGKLDKFAEFLNDPTDQSLHKILADNDKPGSLLRGITRKASDSITRIAGEIEKLKEVLNSFIIMAPKKLRDSEQLQ
jgi:hypothetical protein